MRIQPEVLTFCIILLTSAAWGQGASADASGQKPSQTSATKVELSRKIGLENDSKPEEVILHISPDVKRFVLSIQSSVDAGDVNIEVYDPKGERQGNFLAGTQLSGPKSERVSGSVNKSVDHPQPGDWKVRISPAQATGKVVIESALFY